MARIIKWSLYGAINVSGTSEDYLVAERIEPKKLKARAITICMVKLKMC